MRAFAIHKVDCNLFCLFGGHTKRIPGAVVDRKILWFDRDLELLATDLLATGESPAIEVRIDANSRLSEIELLCRWLISGQCKRSQQAPCPAYKQRDIKVRMARR
jgi:hypothetical protein